MAELMPINIPSVLPSAPPQLLELKTASVVINDSTAIFPSGAALFCLLPKRFMILMLLALALTIPAVTVVSS